MGRRGGGDVEENLLDVDLLFEHWIGKKGMVGGRGVVEMSC